VDDLARVVVWDEGAPSSPNAVGTVDKDERDDGAVPLGLDGLALVLLVFKHMVILRVEQVSRCLGQPGVDVTCSCRILATQDTCAKLAGGDEQVHIVGADEGLGHVNNRALQGCLAVVVGSLLRDIANKLRDLDI